jgi:hypothetical protein
MCSYSRARAMLRASMTGIERMTRQSGCRALSAAVAAAGTSSAAAPIWMMSGRVSAMAEPISSGSADRDSATRLTALGQAAKTARAAAGSISRGNAPKPTRTPI